MSKTKTKKSARQVAKQTKSLPIATNKHTDAIANQDYRHIP